MAIYEFEGNQPIIDPSAYIAELCSVIGQVNLAANTSVWDFATIRGDNEPIQIGPNTNIQESAVLHTDKGYELVLESGVTVGHQACLHGCHVGEGSLIGIQSVVLNGARIGNQCIIGAGALITEHQKIPDRSLVVGSPGKVIRSLSDEDIDKMKAAQLYVMKAKRFKSSLKRIL